jgi:predicted ATPase
MDDKDYKTEFPPLPMLVSKEESVGPKPKGTSEDFDATPCVEKGSVLPQKKNKLKEALIRRQVEQRRMCQQQLSKQLEHASKFGGEVEFTLPSKKYYAKDKNRTMVKGEQTTSELESEAETKGSGGPETESESRTTTAAMNNPIPVHHNHFKNRFRRPRANRMRERDYNNILFQFADQISVRPRITNILKRTMEMSFCSI